MKVEKQINRLKLASQEIRRRLPMHKAGIYYVVPKANWSIDWDGHYITKGVREQFGQDAQVIGDARWLAGQIVHYGSLWSYVGNMGAKHNERNKLVVTVFHGNKGSGDARMEEGLDALITHQNEVNKLVVSNSRMEARFIGWGFRKDKVVMIPLGVDLGIFKASEGEARKQLRNALGIGEGTFCIGSFQKDGDGWEEGLVPKLIKGPDIFVETIAKIKDQIKVHVLLSGPARGYMKAELDKIGVSYTHRMLDNYDDVAELYGALDVYLVSSREEGGPKGVLEALATGVPLVSTKVGMAPDVIEDGKNGLLSELEDADGLAKQIMRIYRDKRLGERLSVQGLKDIQAYDWMRVAAQYYEKVYRPVLENQV